MTRSASSNHKASYRLPREGTKLRLIYNLLYEYRGSHVPIEKWRRLCDQAGHSSVVDCIYKYLPDYYGCDILGQGSHARGPALIGEWMGKVYIDYTQEEKP